MDVGSDFGVCAVIGGGFRALEECMYVSSLMREICCACLLDDYSLLFWQDRWLSLPGRVESALWQLR